jgi:hypothetical protein
MYEIRAYLSTVSKGFSLYFGSYDIDTDPHQGEKSDPQSDTLPHQIKIRI